MDRGAPCCPRSLLRSPYKVPRLLGFPSSPPSPYRRRQGRPTPTPRRRHGRQELELPSGVKQLQRTSSSNGGTASLAAISLLSTHVTPGSAPQPRRLPLVLPPRDRTPPPRLPAVDTLRPRPPRLVLRDRGEHAHLPASSPTGFLPISRRIVSLQISVGTQLMHFMLSRADIGACSFSFEF